MDIIKWLEDFKQGWISHDVEMVVALFTKDVEYWETPFLCLKDYAELKNEWQGVVKQSDIKIDTSITLSSGDRHVVLWNLSYLDTVNNLQAWAGTYIIALNSNGKCYYFHHTGEKKD